MRYFLSFMGYPRSGHTLIAAALNANPNILCSNQKNFYGNVKNLKKDFLIKEIKKASQFTQFKDTIKITGVPKQGITVVGDKTGHRTVDILRNNPIKLGMMKQLVGVPIKWIHVVRNPYDNLATWGMLNYQNKSKNNIESSIKQTLDEVIEKYSILNETIDKLRKSEDVLTVVHEYMITRMHNTLEEMANFLEVSFDPIWRDNVRNAVWNKPRITRNKVKWTPQQKKTVANIIEQYPWLNGYVFGGCGGCGK